MRKKVESDPVPADPRTRRTRKLLQDALVSLLKTRTFRSVSVGDIAAEAMVNRATFYRHYRDKFQLVEAMFSEALDSMLRAAGPAERPLKEYAPRSPEMERAWEVLFRHVADNSRLYRALLSPEGPQSFQRRIREQLVALIRERVGQRVRLSQPIGRTRGSSRMPDSDIPFIFTANLLVANLLWWIEDGTGYRYEQVIDWTRRFLRKGFIGMFDE